MDTTTMQSPVDGSVVVELGGRKLSLALNGRAARLVLEHAGIDLYREVSRLETVNPKELNVFIWALTQNRANGADEKAWPTLADIEEWLCVDNMAEAAEAVMIAFAPREKRGELKNALQRARKQMEAATVSAISTSGPSQESTSESEAASSTD